MSAVWSGPAYDRLPSRHLCSHVAPDSCSRCDGTGADAWEERKLHREPAGRPMSTVELWRLIEACRPNPTTDAEEAKPA